MAGRANVVKFRGGDTEKMTLNVGIVDLGQIDLLVQEGFYTNRSDFMRTAIRSQLQGHADVVKQSVVRRALTMGLQDYGTAELERLQAKGEMLRIQVLGMVRIAEGVTPRLARASIESICVLGILQCSDAVRKALADRISTP